MKINDFKEAEKLINDYEKIKTDIRALSDNKKVMDISLRTYDYVASIEESFLTTKYNTEVENEAAGTEIRDSLIKLLTIRKTNIEAKLKEIGVEIPGLDEINIKVKVNFEIEDGK